MSKETYQFITIARQDPNKQPLAVRKHEFVEIYQPINDDMAREQASRCLACGNPYCEWRCPLHNYIPNWLKLVREGALIAAAELSHQTNSLPEVCGRVCPQERLCEGACTLNEEFGAVTIGHLERYITDQALASGWTPDLSQRIMHDISVAIIGAGPAGLACADVLIRQGIRVVVYERQPAIGGLLTFGIPSFKLDKAVMSHRQRLFSQMGMEFQLNVEIGKTIQIDDLLAQHAAIFVGVGTYQAVNANLIGQTATGVMNALPFLIANTKQQLGYLWHDEHVDLELAGKTVLVLGGGDTAMDCVRTALRLGAKTVTCAYRRDEKNMPGSKREVKNAREEGANFLFHQQPLRIETNRAGQTIGVTFQKTALTEPDQKGRCSTKPIAGSEHFIAADSVILAFGFAPHNLDWLTMCGVQLDKKGQILTGQGTHYSQQTHHPAIFAGGDSVRGSDLVVTAIAEGRRAAQEIIHQLHYQ